jgi:hypothetical protein
VSGQLLEAHRYATIALDLQEKALDERVRHYLVPMGLRPNPRVRCATALVLPGLRPAALVLLGLRRVAIVGVNHGRRLGGRQCSVVARRILWS